MSRILGGIFGKSGIAATTRTGIFKLDDVFYLQNLSTTKFDYLVVGGGGGGGGAQSAGGGGAGGFITGEVINVFERGVYTISIGAGGAVGSAGGNTDLYPPSVSNPHPEYIRALGGGRGEGTTASGPGGSGGGGRAGGPTQIGGAGTPGQGNPGGNVTPQPNGIRSGGGGGAGGAGSPNLPGGIGLQSNLATGSLTYYAGGGGGRGPGFDPGQSPTGFFNGGGGQGGGGASLSSATANTGGGGGALSGAGGSGVVIIRYPLDYRAAKTTGTVTKTTYGNSQSYTFTTPGTISF